MHNQQGYIALTAVLIILAVTLGIATTANLLSIDQNRFALSASEGVQAIGLANGCLDEGLLRLQRDTAYSGGSLNTTEGSCTIGVTGAGSTRTITSQASVGQSTRTVQADVDLTAGFTLTHWQEQ